MNHTKQHHISLHEHYQFVTFRTEESVDAYVRKILKNDEKEHIKQFQVDNYLDSSKNGAYLFDEAIDVFMDVILEEDEKLYDLTLRTFQFLQLQIRNLISPNKQLHPKCKMI